jgi:hypothetical protein
MLFSLNFALKGNNSCETYNFKIKVGNEQIVYWNSKLKGYDLSLNVNYFNTK